MDKAQIYEVCEQELRRNPKAWRAQAAHRLGHSVKWLEKKLAGREWQTIRDRIMGQDAPQVLPPEPAAEPLDPVHPELRSMERRLQASNEQISSLKAKLKEADADRSVFEQAADVIRQEVTAWDPQPMVLPVPKAGQFLVDGALSLTDEHADELVHGASTWGLERFNFDVFRIRLERYVKVVGAYLTQHLPRYHFEHLWLLSLGDKLHGNLHMPGQKYRNHFANDIRAAIAVGEAEADAITKLLQFVPRITMVCVSGNHPRQTARKDYNDPHDNYDFLVAAFLEARLRKYVEEGRLQIFAPRAWTAYCEIRGRTHALNHGDDVQSTWGIPWYGFNRKENRVQSLVAAKNQRVDYFWYGHFHTDIGMSVGVRGRAFHSGAWTLTDDFAINAVSSGHEPSQLLEVLDDDIGRILEVPIFMRDAKREELYWQGQYMPSLGRPVTLQNLALADLLAEAGEFPLIKAS